MHARDEEVRGVRLSSVRRDWHARECRALFWQAQSVATCLGQEHAYCATTEITRQNFPTFVRRSI